MLKQLLSAALICVTLSANAQYSNASLKIEEANKSAVYFEINATPDQAEKAINEYFDKMNADKEKSKGFIFKKKKEYMTFKEAKVDKVEDKMLDYYIKIDRKKQSGDDASKIWISVSKGYNNFIDEKSEEWKQITDFAAYLNEKIIPSVVLNDKIKDNEKSLRKEKENLDDIEKKKKKAEENISKYSTDLENFKTELGKIKS